MSVIEWLHFVVETAKIIISVLSMSIFFESNGSVKFYVSEKVIAGTSIIMYSEYSYFRIISAFLLLRDLSS